MADFIAFDLEIAEVVDLGDDLDPARGLGISCAATLSSDGDLKLWYGKGPGGGYAPRMEDWEAWELANWLHEQQAAGVPIVTWNGLSFDFHVLAVESGDFDTCAQLALGHVDLMFVFHVVKGFPLSLKKAAEACGSHKGAGGIESGEDAPRLWRDGRFEDALAYVAQDARATADVARHLLRYGGFTWISRSGYPRVFLLPRETRAQGLANLTAEKVREWPLPDTSWMSNPIPRQRFLRWLEKEGK